MIKFKKVAEALVGKGVDVPRRADVDMKINNDGMTPLMLAAEECRVDLVQVLVELGADPSKRSDEEDQWTAEKYVLEDEEDCPKETAAEIRRLLHKGRDGSAT